MPKQEDFYMYNNEQLYIKPLLKGDLDKIIGFLETVRFGSVAIVIQDGRVLQIEKKEQIKIE